MGILLLDLAPFRIGWEVHPRLTKQWVVVALGLPGRLVVIEELCRREFRGSEFLLVFRAVESSEVQVSIGIRAVRGRASELT